MNNKAFTMIEVIAIIALLGVILLIALPKFFSTKNDVNIKERQKKEELIINSARLYFINNNIPLGETVEVSTLCSEAYIQCPIVNPVDNTNMEGQVTSYIDANGVLSYRYDE